MRKNRNRLHWAGAMILAVGLGLLTLTGDGARGQQVLQYGFESRDPVWVPGAHDARYKETAHRLTDDGTARGGQRCEMMQLQAEQGSYIHYTLDVGRAPVTEELSASLWVKANRPGVGMLCRVVLPRERDPQHADQPLTTLVQATPYTNVGRWQLLRLTDPVRRLREQQQLLRAELKRDVDVSAAFIDRVVLNVYGGPGRIEVYTDDLEVGPVEAARQPGVAPRPAGGVTPARPAVNRRAAQVLVQGNHLLVSGKGFFLRMVRHTGTPLAALRYAGFNTVWLDESTPTGLLDSAVDLGFWVMPSVRPPLAPPGGRTEGVLTANDAFARNVSRFLELDAVLCWDLGSNLKYEDFPKVLPVVESFKAADPSRPLSADVWDGYRIYERSIDPLMLGIHRWPLMTTLELAGYRNWLVQRRFLAAPDAFCWTWVQTHLPDWFTTLAYDGAGPGPAVRTVSAGGAAAQAGPEPMGPEPDQIRLLAYTAIAAGCRGLGFWSDRFLADSHTGRDRLLALALLNQELQMLEPLLVSGKEPDWLDTKHPLVKTAVIRSDKAILALPIWMGAGSQFVPGQGAASTLTVSVPGVPNTYQAWEVSPGGVRSYRCRRVPGGVEVDLHNFGLTAALVFTADLDRTGLVVRFQKHQRAIGPRAAQWAHDQAAEELTKVTRVNEELEKLDHALPDGAQVLARAREELEKCSAHRANGLHSEAYDDAQNALRALRILMRAHWEEAVKQLTTPVASPYAVSFYTLPRHWQFWDRLKGARAGANVLRDGDFELPPDRVAPNWLVQEVPNVPGSEAAAVVPLARRVAAPLKKPKKGEESPAASALRAVIQPVSAAAAGDAAKEEDEEDDVKPHKGKQCLMLKISPRNKLLPPPFALERTFLAIHSPAVRLAPGTPVRIRVWVRVPGPITASPDGALFYDSAGGEPLAVRITGATDWREFVLYRRVPASGTLSVTLALTGLGTVYFDDVQIEPLTPKASPESAATPSGAEARAVHWSPAPAPAVSPRPSWGPAVSPPAPPGRPAAAPPAFRDGPSSR